LNPESHIMMKEPPPYHLQDSKRRNSSYHTTFKPSTLLITPKRHLTACSSHTNAIAILCCSGWHQRVQILFEKINAMWSEPIITRELINGWFLHDFCSRDQNKKVLWYLINCKLVSSFRKILCSIIQSNFFH